MVLSYIQFTTEPRPHRPLCTVVRSLALPGAAQPWLGAGAGGMGDGGGLPGASLLSLGVECLGGGRSIEKLIKCQGCGISDFNAPSCYLMVGGGSRVASQDTSIPYLPLLLWLLKQKSWCISLGNEDGATSSTLQFPDENLGHMLAESSRPKPHLSFRLQAMPSSTTL